MTRSRPAIPMILAFLTFMASAAGAEDAPKDNITAVRDENGRYYTADDVPTFKIAEDGTVDWLTYSGFRRYHSECHVCHGPEGEGSSYAPALKTSAINMDYYDFVDVVTNGRRSERCPRTRDACLRRERQRDVLSRRHLRLSEARRADALPREFPPRGTKSDAIKKLNGLSRHE